MKTLILLLILFGWQAVASEPTITPVLILKDEETFLRCEMQSQPELKQGYVNFTTCLTCKLVNDNIVCFVKKTGLGI